MTKQSFTVPPADAEFWIESIGARRARKGKFIWIDGWRELADGWVEVLYREGWQCPDVSRDYQAGDVVTGNPS